MRKLFYIVLSVVIFFLVGLHPLAYAAGQAVNATETGSSLYLDGDMVIPHNCAGYNINGNNYYMLRDLARVFTKTSSKFDVQWDAKTNTINIVTGKNYDDSKDSPRGYFGYKERATPMEAKLMIDRVFHNVTAYNINGNNFFKLRDLGEAIPFDVKWDAVRNDILLYSKTPKDSKVIPLTAAAKSNALKSTFARWEEEIESYIYTDDKGNINFLRVGTQHIEVPFSGPKERFKNNEIITVTKYDNNYKEISAYCVPLELAGFGAFYAGKDYNYIAFGQENKGEDDSKEIIRIVKYDQDFNRIDSASARDCFTVMPFGKAARMDESEKHLVLHTARTRYLTEDGLHHQSQLTIIVDKNSMRVVNDLGRFQDNHVSHSFNQFVKFDGNDGILVDHGDAHPRSVVLSRPGVPKYTKHDLFAIPGGKGDNVTGVSVGGFEISDTHYLVAMNTIDHSLVSHYGNVFLTEEGTNQRDIIICSLSKKDPGHSTVNQKTIARYVGTDKIGSIPQLVKINEGKLMVLWQEFNLDGERGPLKYVYMDGKGNQVSEIYSLDNYVLSKCQPIVHMDSVIWFTDFQKRTEHKGYTVTYKIPIVGM